MPSRRLAPRSLPSGVFYRKPDSPTPRNVRGNISGSASSWSRLRRTRKSDQSTLTQLNYIVPSFEGSGSGENADLRREGEFEEPRLRKKRRVAVLTEGATREHLKQSTLTQIEWFDAGYLTDGSEGEHGYTVEPKSQKADDNDGWARGPGSTQCSVEGSVAPARLAATPHRSVKGKSKLVSGFSTPQKPIAPAVPSSQSPSATPLVSPVESPNRFRQNPFHDAPSNIIASRDRIPPLINSNMTEQSQKRPLRPEEEKENLCATKREFSLSTIQTGQRFGSLRSPRDLIDATSPPKLLVQHTMNDAYNVRSSQATTVDLTQTSPHSPSSARSVEDDGHETPPTLKSDFRKPPTVLLCSHKRPSSPMEDESQVQFSAMSPDDELGYYSSLSTIQNSEEIITSSEMLPESLTDG